LTILDTAHISLIIHKMI